MNEYTLDRDAVAEVLDSHLPVDEWDEKCGQRIHCSCGQFEWTEESADQWNGHLADATVALARPVNEVKAEALDDAANDLYGDDGPTVNGPAHPLSVATWLHERAEGLRDG